MSDLEKLALAARLLDEVADSLRTDGAELRGLATRIDTWARDRYGREQVVRATVAAYNVELP